jgi:hypothetical protein
MHPKEQVEIAGAGRGVVGVYPPRTISIGDDVPDMESVAAVRIPSAGAMVESLQIGLAFAGVRSREYFSGHNIK